MFPPRLRGERVLPQPLTSPPSVPQYQSHADTVAHPALQEVRAGLPSSESLHRVTSDELLEPSGHAASESDDGTDDDGSELLPTSRRSHSRAAVRTDTTFETAQAAAALGTSCRPSWTGLLLMWMGVLLVVLCIGQVARVGWPSSYPYPLPTSGAALNMSEVLVIGAATGYHVQDVFVFVRSFRLHCTQCQLLLLVSGPELTEEDRELYAHFHVQLLDVSALRPLYPTGSLVNYAAGVSIPVAHFRWQLAYDYLRALPNFAELGDTGSFRSYSSEPDRNPISAAIVASARRPGDYQPAWTAVSHLFFADLRDVLWQGNVFDWLPYQQQYRGDDLLWGELHRSSPFEQWRDSRRQRSSAKVEGEAGWDDVTYEGVWVFAEEEYNGRNNFNNRLTDCADSSFQRRFNASPIICSGTVLGSYAAILRYLQAMQAYMLDEAYIGCSRGQIGFDQGAHMLLVYGGGINASVYIVPNARGPVATVALALRSHPETLRYSAYGELVNTWNEPYAVVHQFDRSPWWKQQVQQQYNVSKPLMRLG